MDDNERRPIALEIERQASTALAGVLLVVNTASRLSGQDRLKLLRTARTQLSQAILALELLEAPENKEN